MAYGSAQNPHCTGWIGGIDHDIRWWSTESGLLRGFSYLRLVKQTYDWGAR
ncbi:MAG: hypothetical protein KatS3mg011_0716 [Acidimicrobiia bacterium]|nr:MAG: hypothetical protein KatS3mg011_0716 [Acidimicrobiia bacterium]